MYHIWYAYASANRTTGLEPPDTPLPEKMRDRLFDPMVSACKKKASQSRLGLGLYVVRLIAEYHGGDASAENRDEPLGVAVTMRLLLAET